jgi:hypothetical protein
MKKLLAGIGIVILTGTALGQARKPATRRPPPTTTPVPPTVTPYVWEQEPTSFHDMAFGWSEDFLPRRARCHNSDTGIPGAAERTCSAQNFSVGRASMMLSYRFSNAKFVEAFGAFASDDYADVRTAFVGKYGPPTRSVTSTVQNRMGASFEQEVLTWDGPNVYIALNRFGSNVTEGVFVVSTQSYRQAKDAANVSAQKKLKDAL